MSLLNGLSKTQRFIFSILICLSAVLGYLLYNTNAERILGQKQLKEAREENLDLTQDIEIFKQKYDNLEKQVKALDNKVVKIEKIRYKHKKKSKLYAAGKSSKKSKYKKGKVNYKKLYFDLKKKCYGSEKYKGKSKYKSKTKYKSSKKYNSNKTYNKSSYRTYKRKTS